jgi:hypothetical protein
LKKARVNSFPRMRPTGMPSVHNWNAISTAATST